MNKLVSVAISVLGVALLAIPPGQAVARSFQTGLWQSIVGRLATMPPARQSEKLVQDSCLGELPSSSAQSHVLSYYSQLARGVLTSGRIRVVDSDKKFYCTVLSQYWGEWMMDIPKERVPDQFQSVTPREYRYVSPLARCVTSNRAEWCDGFMGRWKLEANYDLDVTAMLASYMSSCGRGACPFLDSRDRVQADYYLLSLLGQKIFDGAVR